MLHVASGFGLVVELGFALFCLVDVALSREQVVRWLPRWAWVLALLAFPLAASIGWCAAGRHHRALARGTAVPEEEPAVAPVRTVTLDGSHEALPADPAPLRDLEHESLLHRWEADLRRREEQQRRRLHRPDPDDGQP